MQFSNISAVAAYVTEEANSGALFDTSLDAHYWKLSATERRRLVRDVAQWIVSEARRRGFEWGQNWWALLQCLPVTQQASQRLQNVLARLQEG